MATTNRSFSNKVTTFPTTGITNGLTVTSTPAAATSSTIDHTATPNRTSGVSPTSATPLTGIALGQQEEQAEQNPYDAIYEAYQSMMNSNAAQQKAELDKLYAEMANNLNAGYDKSANNAYINYKQGQKALPEQLSQYGVTGGASESANLRLQAAYGTNLAENEYNRNSGLSDIRQNQIQQYSDVNSSLNSALADAYLQSSTQAAEWEQEQKEKAEAKAKEEAAKAEQAEIDEWNNKVMANMLKRTSEGYEVESWTESNGKMHYRIVGNNKKNAEEQAKALEAAIAAAQEQALKWANAGYTVTTKDADGIPWVTVTGLKSNSSGGSSGTKSSGSSSGSKSYGSTSLPVVSSKTTGSTSKSSGSSVGYLQTGSETAISNAYNVINGLYQSGKLSAEQAKALLRYA